MSDIYSIKQNKMAKQLEKFETLRPEFNRSLKGSEIYLECAVNENTYIQIWASQKRVSFWEPIHLKMRVVQGWNNLVDEDVYLDTAEEANSEVIRFLFVNGSSFELSLINNVDSNISR